MNNMTPPAAAAQEFDPKRPLQHPRVKRALKRETIRGDWDDLFGEAVPEALLTPYPLDEDGERRNAAIMKKYADRPQNTRRAFNRVQRYLPELLVPGDSLDVFELSTAHGAVLEVARHYGHNILGNDFANMVFARQGAEVATTRGLNDDSFTRETDDWGFEITDDPNAQDWPYRHITEAMDIPMSVFDCGKLPYPLDDKSVDVTICMQAIEHYCHPDHWMDVIAEMARFTRQSIFILLNPMHKRFKDVEGYEDSYNKARLALRGYNANGFRNVAVHMHWGQALGFKLIAV